MRLFISLALLIVLSSCATRQSFQTESGSEQGWWRCDPRSEREWRCSDGESVEETTDLAAASSYNIVPEIPVQPEPQPQFLPVEPSPEVKETNEAQEEQKPIVVAAEINEPSTIQAKDETSLTQTNKKGDWVIQFGAFRSEQEAQKLSNKVIGSIVSKTQNDSGTWFRVVLVGFESSFSANQKASEIKQQNPSLSTWVRKG